MDCSLHAINCNFMWCALSLSLCMFLSLSYAHTRNLVTAMWYLSQALGTLLNAGVAQIPGLNLLQEFFMYMALMSVVTVIFATINRRFRYRTPD